jgi:hypothetical protein
MVFLTYQGLFAITIVASLPLFFLALFKEYRNYMSLCLGVILLPVYFIGMFRSDGIDINSYRQSFNNSSSSEIFDPGFNSLMAIANFSGFSFESFLLAIGAIIATIYYRLSHHFKVNYGIVLFILMTHLIIVRDFSQFRLGLAASVALLGYASTGYKKGLLYFLAVSLHFTTAVLISLLIYFNFIQYKSSKAKTFWLLGSLAGITLIGLGVSFFSFIDPRIDIYLNWNAPGYGQENTSMLQFFFCGALAAIHLFFVQNRKPKLDVFMFLFISAAAVNLAFSDIAIFSSRLTNLCLSLYPFSIALAVSSRRPLELRFVMSVFFLATVSMRENSQFILSRITVSFFGMTL